jgi:hypothetical protein
VVNFKIKLVLSFMVPDCVYKFQIICLQGTYVSYRQDNKKPKLSNVWYIGLDLDQKKWWTRQMVQMQIWLSFMTVSPGFRGARQIIWNLYTQSWTIKDRPSLILNLTTWVRLSYKRKTNFSLLCFKVLLS